jgi:hypothetical protein
MLARLIIVSLLGTVLGNEAWAEQTDDASAVAKYPSGQSVTSEGQAASSRDASLLQGDPFGRTAFSLFDTHFDLSRQQTDWGNSFNEYRRFSAINPDRLESPAGFVEVFIDDWQVAEYKSFSFHLKADDIWGLEIKSKFSF